MEGKKRPGFMYYYDEFNPVFFNICDEDTGRLFKALISYDLDRTEPDFPEGSMLGVLFRVLLPKLEYSERKYRETCEKRRTAANIRWKNRHQDVQPDACICTAEAAEDANNNRNTNPNNNSNPNKRENKEKRPAGFVKPSRAELLEYACEKGLHVDVDTFLDHYESNGWHVGKSHMKDWRAALRNWSRRESGHSTVRTGQPTVYDYGKDAEECL